MLRSLRVGVALSLLAEVVTHHYNGAFLTGTHRLYAAVDALKFKRSSFEFLGFKVGGDYQQQSAVDGAELLGYGKPCDGGGVHTEPGLSRLEACASFDCASLMRFAVIIQSLSMNFALRPPAFSCIITILII